MDPSSIPAAPLDAPADSSTAAPAPADTPQPSQDPGVPAAPPAATDAKVEPEVSLRDAIAQTVSPKKPDTPEKADPADPKAEKPEDAKQEKPGDKAPKTADDAAKADENLPFGKHPRWKQVVGENRALRQFRETAAPRLQEYDRIVDFMHKNEIAPEEMQGLYVLGAMLKNDPEQALKTLREMIAPLEAFVGDRLPEDLASEVEEGSISVERARELARMRSSQSFQQERQEAQQREQERLAAAKAAETRTSQAKAVTDWEQKVASQDPDYPLMKEWVVMELTRLQRETPAADAQAAVALAEKAYRSVQDKFRQTANRGREVPRGPSSRDVPANNGRQPAPTSMLDAVRQAL